MNDDTRRRDLLACIDALEAKLIARCPIQAKSGELDLDRDAEYVLAMYGVLR